MPRPHPSTYLPLWDRALDPDIEIGIAVKMGNTSRENFRNHYLYPARNEAADPSKYEGLIVFLPAGDHTDEIWICKKAVELGEGA